MFKVESRACVLLPVLYGFSFLVPVVIHCFSFTMAVQTETLVLPLDGTGKLHVDSGLLIDNSGEVPNLPREKALETENAAAQSTATVEEVAATKQQQGLGSKQTSTIRLVSASNNEENKEDPNTAEDEPDHAEKSHVSVTKKSDEQPLDAEFPNTKAEAADDGEATTNSATADPVNIALPAASKAENEELAGALPEITESTSDTKSNASGKKDNANDKVPSQPVALSSAVTSKDDEIPTTTKDAAAINEPAPKQVTKKKSLGMFGTLRRLSAANLKPEKNDHTEPVPKPVAPASLPITKVPAEHVESKKKSPPASTVENKKTGGLLRSIRAAIRFSSKSTPKPPSVAPPKSPSSQTSPVSSVNGRQVTEKASKSALKSVPKPTPAPVAKTTARQSLKPVSKQPSQRSPSKPVRQSSILQHKSPVVLRPAATWSPPGTNPVLSSNPSAKLYTVWPRYPIIDAQIAEVQKMLEDLLLDDKKAIETSREPGTQLVIHFWKAPLTPDQAEVVKSNSNVSVGNSYLGVSL